MCVLALFALVYLQGRVLLLLHEDEAPEDGVDLDLEPLVALVHGPIDTDVVSLLMCLCIYVYAHVVR